ncbi:MAG TPA: cell division protein FtsX [Chromatiales bacterium]|nr:cell division protein FtsX [Chromatiales bacterium]
MLPDFWRPSRRGGPRGTTTAWLMRQLQIAIESLGRLARAPASSLMTVAVIGIALSLPTSLYVLLSNLQALSGGWDGTATISLYLRQKVDDEQAERIARKLRLDPAIDEVRVIGKRAAIEEFKRFSGFGQALEALDSNPLPAVLVIQPVLEESGPEAAAALVERLRALPGAEQVQLDLQWVKRFHAITRIARRAVLLIGGILVLAVLLTVGNTIRLEIQNRRQEIEIAKLVGATDAFIRRPFLYTGLWYGLFGGLLAWLLVASALFLLSGPVERLAGLYESDFSLDWLGLDTTLTLLLSGALLGLAGAWLSVSRHLNDIEPG